MKYITIFLLLANLAYFAWSKSPFAQPIVVSVPPERPLLNNGMTLLQEYQTQRQQLARSEAELTKTCLQVEIFATTDEADAFVARALAQGLDGGLIMLGKQLPVLYQVYLPPASSRAVATIVLDGLMEKAETEGLLLESYLVTRGKLENAIALGVFEDEESAAEIEAKVAQLGYEPRVEHIVRSEDGFAVWLQGPSSLTLRSSEWLDLAQESSDLVVSENLCETIAQGEQFP